MKKIIETVKKIISNNKFKYILSVFIILSIFVLSNLVINEKVNFLMFFDVPTLMFVCGLPYCVMWVIFGNSKTKKIISVPFIKEQTDALLNESLLFFKMFNKLIWYSTLLVMIINSMNIILKLNDIKSLELEHRMLFLLTLLCPIYALLINLVFIIPYTIFIKRKLNKNN
jgi:hypothetical protein